MEKKRLLELIIQQLEEDLAALLDAARSAHAASIHEENIPDNKYDTLSLEASYVAQGQANRAQEIREALGAYRRLELRSFRDGSPIRLTALVSLEGEDGDRMVFIGPKAGGLKVGFGGEVVVITPDSPLGRDLLGKLEGDVVDVETAGDSRQYEIVAVA